MLKVCVSAYKVCDTLEVYKIVSGKYDSEISDLVQVQEQNHNAQGHPYKVFEKQCRFNLRKNTFCNRVRYVTPGMTYQNNCSLFKQRSNED